MLFKKPKHRIFDYEPRFYNPSEDKNELRKKRLKFRYSRRHSTKKRSSLIWLILIFIAGYIYLKFAGVI